MFRSLAALFLLSGAAALAADPVPDTKQLDKTLIATLREIHDRGADLYNLSKDYPAAYRLYEGSLLTVKPLLAHRPDVQKTIEDGLAAAAKHVELDKKPFVLHETIEKVRAELKLAPKVEPKPKEPMPKPKEPAPMPKPKEPEPKPKEPEPKPKSETATITGKITVQGKALAEGTVTFVSLDQKAPKVATGAVKEGAFTVKDVPPGKYAVAVTSKTAGAVPAKFATTDTSSLTFTAKSGANEFNIELK